MVSESITPARFTDVSAMLLAGNRQRYRFEDIGQIPAQWEVFSESIEKVPYKWGSAAWGVVQSTPEGDGMDYTCAFEVQERGELPQGFSYLEVPAQRYAIFAYEGHVGEMSGTIDRIFNEWLPGAGVLPAGFPDLLERYGPAFDPDTMSGDVEIWIPVKSA